MERGVCSDCLRAEKEQERKQENERAASLANELGFSALTGSEKQIAWATTIRQQCYEKVVANQPRPTVGLDKLIAAINLETSAKWWIDNRAAIGLTVLKLIAANYPAAFQALTIRKSLKEA